MTRYDKESPRRKGTAFNKTPSGIVFFHSLGN
jgi:hypothetical protein